MIQNRYYGLNFTTTQGTTQGGIVSPTQLNVVVDNVLRKWLAMTVKDKAVV